MSDRSIYSIPTKLTTFDPKKLDETRTTFSELSESEFPMVYEFCIMKNNYCCAFSSILSIST